MVVCFQALVRERDTQTRTLFPLNYNTKVISQRCFKRSAEIQHFSTFFVGMVVYRPSKSKIKTLRRIYTARASCRFRWCGFAFLLACASVPSSLLRTFIQYRYRLVNISHPSTPNSNPRQHHRQLAPETLSGAHKPIPTGT